MGRLYDTSAWKRVRRLQLQMHPLCQYGPHDRVTPATEVDHRVSIEEGGAALDLANLVSSCHACHSSKTRTMDNPAQGGVAKRRKIKGCDSSGRPLDPLHPWNLKSS